MTEVFTVLTEVVRDNFRNIQLKQHLVPALGEFLFYASTQEDTDGHEIANWDVPGKTDILLYLGYLQEKPRSVLNFLLYNLVLFWKTQVAQASWLITGTPAIMSTGFK